MWDAAEVRTNLDRVRARIAAAAERKGRDPAGVRLVAVTKTFPVEAVLAAAESGQREFGENRVQEAVDKVAAVRAAGYAPVWHLIGHLQTNKARAAANIFDMIQSVDSLHLAAALNDRVTQRFPVLVEVNVADESSKTGFSLGDAQAAVEALRWLPNLDVRGLMTVAPAATDPEDVRPVFRKLADLGRRLELAELSMGMSGDFAVAVEEGATIVRVGSAIFGHRGNGTPAPAGTEDTR
ncbi:MAG: YggS family pyridoxal phosphate-dependent enzyme [Dehalococcoidia bacterium]